MLPKAHLTSHSRMSGSRWVITPWWLSGSWRSFLYSSSVYSCHLFLISSGSVRCLPFLSFIVPIFAWNVPLVSLIFLKRSLVFPVLLCSKSKPLHMHKNGYNKDFPVGPLVKNLPDRHMDSTRVQEDPTCHAAKPVQQGPCNTTPEARALELTRHSYWSHVPRVCALQQEKPPRWEAHTTQLERSPGLLQLGQAHTQHWRPSAPKNKKFFNKKNGYN